MSRIEHLTPRYIMDQPRLMTYEKSHPESPWLNKPVLTSLVPGLGLTIEGFNGAQVGALFGLRKGSIGSSELNMLSLGIADSARSL